MPYKDADNRRRYQAEYGRRRREERRAGVGGPPGGNPGPEAPLAAPVEPIPLRTAADALAAVREQMNACRGDRATNVQCRARTVAYLLSVGLRAIELCDLSDRIATLEARVG